MLLHIKKQKTPVIPAKAGIQLSEYHNVVFWIPAFAGMTVIFYHPNSN